MTLFLLIIALIFQELASAGAAIFAAYHSGIDPWLIHAIWLAATLADIAIGYALGKWVQWKFKNSKLDTWAKKWSVKIEHAIGKTGLKISLMLLGFVSYPYLIAFAASWLPSISLEDIFLYATAGNFVWYLFEWAAVLGITAAGHNYQLIFVTVALAGVILILAANTIKRLL